MKAKALMVLGTGSDVGKSFVAAGLCRVISDWGYRVAPFKAQNMSNNSFVTEDGREIARAQAVQAACARVVAEVDMNPVLLKPSGDCESQVVLHGKAAGRLRAKDFLDFKNQIRSAVEESYLRLAEKNDVIVIEGAGSCAELNLKEHDIVNLKMAEFADARCVLVGDIDRGGIFASLIGTLDLLEVEEKNRIQGMIINKFRGHRDLFQKGIHILEERTGKKVLGVLPYVRDLWIESEDAVVMQGPVPEKQLDITVVLLPHMSNFTDFEILQNEPHLRVRYLKSPEELDSTDLLILPGTKATIPDLIYLKNQGWDTKIQNYFSSGGHVLGICGGYQMMGEWIKDPQGIESNIREVSGLGFFQMTTEFLPEKILRQVKSPISISLFGHEIQGEMLAYEIHMGRTVHSAGYAGFGEGGAVHPSGRAAGTYYHGLFESAQFRTSFFAALGRSAGKRYTTQNENGGDIKEKNYDRLARLFTEYLDLSGVKTYLNSDKNLVKMRAEVPGTLHRDRSRNAKQTCP